MSTTKRRNLAGRPSIARLRPTFDRLENRTALSATPFDGGSFGSPGEFGSPGGSTPLEVLTTTPADSSTLTTSPTTLVVGFSQALSGFSIGLADFALVHLNSDGSTTPLSLSEARLIESLDPSDLTGSQLDLALSRPLTPGQYRLILLGSNQLTDVNGNPVSDNGQDQVISSFTLAPQVVGIDGATKLGTVGSTVVETSGHLDLASNPGAVDYYQVILGPGHRWSLGLSVSTQSLGSPLDSTLSLFDASGARIATDSTGLPSDPTDPFLFQGVDPGTYYIGVSARGNVPTLDGSYDPASSSIENLGASSAGGDFQLSAVATVADQPTRVLGVQVDRADPLSPLPTGLTLQFSGAIQVGGLDQPLDPPLKLVDQDGASWAVTAAGYDPRTGQLRIVFDQALPYGFYTLELTSSTSLVDLASAVPVAEGLTQGELASFQVGAMPSLDPGDIGPIFPGAASSDTSINLTVAAGSSATRQFTVTIPGVYAIEGVSPTSGLSYTLEDDQGTSITTGPSQSISGANDVSLATGVYTLTIQNPTDQPVTLPVSIIHKQTVFSELMDGGISQGAALNLRLVTPQANFGLSTVSGPTSFNGLPTASTSPIGSAPSTETTTATNPVAGTTPSIGASTTVNVQSPANPAVTTPQSGAVGLAVTSSSTVASLLGGFGPVGLVSSQANQISVVGSTATSGSFATASNAPGLSTGLVGIPEANDLRSRPGNRSRARVVPIEPDQPATGDDQVEQIRVSSTDAGLLAQSVQSRRADDRSLAGAEWISRMVSNTVRWFRITGEPSDDLDSSGVNVAIASNATKPELEAESQVESASLASPIGLTVVMTVAAFRYRKHFRFGKKRRETRAEVRQMDGTASPHRIHSKPCLIRQKV